jgi:hypothetical protein
MRWVHIVAGLIGITSGAVALAARLKRHLGRMGVAMLIATGSLFLGQPRSRPRRVANEHASCGFDLIRLTG